LFQYHGLSPVQFKQVGCVACTVKYSYEAVLKEHMAAEELEEQQSQGDRIKTIKPVIFGRYDVIVVDKRTLFSSASRFESYYDCDIHVM
jgi:hypothetical protein